MRVRSRIAAVAAAAASTLFAAASAWAHAGAGTPTIVFRPASPANYTVAHRPASAIRMVVIHVTESSALGAITWFRNPKARASANYVVSQQGGITEMVPDSDIAWQAGNWAINRESIGIEHAGYTYVRGSFTDAEYRASAQLVASEMRHYVLPIDRKHIIGHYQVPDPNHPGLFGGFAHHTDPGPYWNWPLYIRYVEAYAKGSNPAPVVVPAAAPKAKRAPQPTITGHVDAGKVRVSSSGLQDGQTVAGYVKWSASVGTAQVTRVDFLVDGRLRWTEKHAPYVFGGDGGGWDTTGETNGTHVLTLRVVAKNGATAGNSVRVNVENTPFAVAASLLTNGQTVSGKVAWEADPSGANADHIDFLVDGKLAWTENQAPFVFGGDGSTWDTTKLANGPHTLAMRAVAVDGRVAETSLTVNVANAQQKPPPPAMPPAIAISIRGLSDGKTVYGRVQWTARVTGGKPDHVDFSIDGQWRWTETASPYTFNGDSGTWDTTQETPGQHVLTVAAVRADGYVYSRATVTVNIAVAVREAASMSVASSLADGSTVHGVVPWSATVAGATPSRVEFWIDGVLLHTEHDAPYDFGDWDTTRVQNGPHSLSIRAVASDGTITKANATITVANAVPQLAIASQSLTDGKTVSGSIDWNVVTSGPTPDRVDYFIDGRLRHTERTAPYDYTWDTTQDRDGPHTLLVRATAGNQTVQVTITVTVRNTLAQLAIASQSLTDGKTVFGSLDWNVVTSGPTPDRVEYWIDGTLRHTETSAPYDFAWDTTRELDGAHTLLVKAIAGSQTVQATITVTVRNAVATLAIASQSLADGKTVSGSLDWNVVTSGPTPDRVEYWIDGTLRHTDTSAPYDFAWDTTRERDGAHTLVARAISGGQTAQATITVTVHNTVPQLAIASQSLTDGKTVSGALDWNVVTSGPTPDRVDYFIDGTLRHTERTAPYDYTWDTTQDRDGPHSLLIRATAGSQTVQATITVTVHNAVAPPPTPGVTIASQTIADGSTLRGTVAWSATVTGDVRRVEYYIGNRRVDSERRSPYEYDLDTTRLQNGAYTLTVRVTGTDGTSASVSVSVTVSNP